MNPTAPACEKTMETATRLLLGESVAPEECQAAEQHARSCTTCQQAKAALADANTSLKEAFGTELASSSFIARTMASLPAAPEPSTVTADTPRVFRAPPARSPWNVAAVAAAVAIALLAGIAALAILRKPADTSGTKVLAVARGQLLDSSGAAVRELKAGTVYKVADDAVVPVSEHGTVKLKSGAEFQVVLANNEPELQLEQGDLYAWGRDGAQRKPINVTCSSFQTTLHSGDFFVAESRADQTSGIVIVFNGDAKVKRDAGELRLTAGQVFFVVEADGTAFAHTLELNEAVARLQDEPPAQRPNLLAMRRDYQKQIKGYQQELSRLERLLKTEQDARKLAELQERQQLVSTYLDAHQRKLKTLWRDFPHDEIERGLHGHSDPATWM